MAAGKTFALCVAILLGGGLAATANGSTDDGTLWRYWQARGSSETTFSNLSTNLSNFSAAPAPVPLSLAPMPVAVPRVADVNLNFAGPTYPDASTLIRSGSAMPWYQSPSYTKFFGGRVPDAQVRQAFTDDVMGRVREIFHNSGLGDVTFTRDSATSARHTMSVVSGGSFDGDNTILGMTYTGGNGFSFLDNFRHPLIGSVDDLELAVAKNLAHELLHSFGGDHIHMNGVCIDAAHTTWDSLVSTDPESTRFSPEAAATIRGLLNGSAAPTYGLASAERIADHDSFIIDGRHASSQTVQPVPEPSTFALVLLPALGYLALRHRSRRAA